MPTLSGGRKWLLQPEQLKPHENLSLDWLDVLPAGLGSKHQRAYLLLSMKQFVQLMLQQAIGIDNRRGLSNKTTVNWFNSLRLLARWMVDRSQWRFSQLALSDLAEFLSERAPRSKADGISSATLSAWISKLERLYEYRGKYVGSLRVNPSGLREDQCLLNFGRPIKRWSALDDAIALPLIRDAIGWLERHADYVCAASDRWANLIDSGVVLSNRQRARRSAQFSKEIETEEALQKIRRELRDPTRVASSVLADAVRLTDAACVTIFLFLVGMRVSELVRLDAGCLEVQDGEDGSKSYWLKGIAAKSRGADRTWVCSPPIPYVVKTLESLHSAARRKASQSALMLGRNGNAISAVTSRRISRVGVNAVSQDLRHFARAPFREQWDETIRLHPHRARKTFAKFVVRRDKGALDSLALHFGHVNSQLTDECYVGHDFELAALLDEEDRKDLAECLTDLLSSERLGGKAGEQLIERRTQVGALQFRGKRGLRTLVERLIDDGVQLAPCDWGYCVYSQVMSACRGSAEGPDGRYRSPDVCAECANFAVSDRHRVWWETRLAREVRFLQREDLPEQTQALVQVRVRNTQRILRGIISTPKTRK